MASAGLALTSTPVVAAPCDEKAREDDDKDRGQACGEGGPVNVDQAEPIVRLVKADVCRFVGLILLDVKRGFVGHLDGRCWGRRGGLLGKVILDEHFLPILVDAGLSSGDEEWGHVEE